MDELIKAARRKEREERLDALKDNRRQRSHKFKTPKDYDRKNKDWKSEHE